MLSKLKVVCILYIQFSTLASPMLIKMLSQLQILHSFSYHPNYSYHEKAFSYRIDSMCVAG